MLNRTNRTLSANLNRLNLGTRSLAVNASGNNGSLALRTAHVRLFVDVRAGSEEYPDFVEVKVPPFMGPKSTKSAMSPMSGSSPAAMQLATSCQARDQQGQPIIALAIPPAIPAVDLPVDGRTRRGDATRTTTPRRPARTTLLGWRRDRSRRASRAARVVLVSDAAP